MMCFIKLIRNYLQLSEKQILDKFIIGFNIIKSINKVKNQFIVVNLCIKLK